jgi:hypothetical protein
MDWWQDHRLRDVSLDRHDVHRNGHDVQGPAFGFFVDASDIFANESDGDQASRLKT